MNRFFIFIACLHLASNSMAAIVTSADKTQSCTLYRVTTQGNPAQSRDNEYIPNDVYGFSLRNLEIEFTKKQVSVDVRVHIIAGFDKNLTQQRVIISATNPRLKFLTNQINHNIFLFDRVCIGTNNEIIYAGVPE